MNLFIPLFIYLFNSSLLYGVWQHFCWRYYYYILLAHYIIWYLAFVLLYYGIWRHYYYITWYFDLFSHGKWLHICWQSSAAVEEKILLPEVKLSRRKNPAAGGKVKTQKQLLPAARCSVKEQKTPAAGDEVQQ